MCSQDVAGLKFYILDCGCILYKRVLRDGDLDSQVGIYRDTDDGPCEIYMVQDKDWMSGVIDETIVDNSRFQVEVKQILRKKWAFDFAVFYLVPFVS